MTVGDGLLAGVDRVEKAPERLAGRPVVGLGQLLLGPVDELSKPLFGGVLDGERPGEAVAESVIEPLPVGELLDRDLGPTQEQVVDRLLPEERPFGRLGDVVEEALLPLDLPAL